ncbi:hypothetical protein HPB51_004553 [Rhipicephalus microplus]|uniref:Uncharacterized protein n=1 Tax=Rhipicephalus microplus TaxID=6941 RepID=A0A9J6EMS5_RHIMP|nr:hypothetical protein HPB51_004553 [Rhipicephalus microplus]
MRLSDLTKWRSTLRSAYRAVCNVRKTQPQQKFRMVQFCCPSGCQTPQATTRFQSSKGPSVTDDDLSKPDANTRPSVSVAATHKTDGTTAGAYPEKPVSWTSRALESALVVASEILQYPWGADALILVGIVLLASFLVVLYYAVAVVLPIMVLAVILAMINSALFENSRFLHVLRRLGLT